MNDEQRSVLLKRGVERIKVQDKHIKLLKKLLKGQRESIDLQSEIIDEKNKTISLLQEQIQFVQRCESKTKYRDWQIWTVEDGVILVERPDGMYIKDETFGDTHEAIYFIDQYEKE